MKRLAVFLIALVLAPLIAWGAASLTGKSWELVLCSDGSIRTAGCSGVGGGGPLPTGGARAWNAPTVGNGAATSTKGGIAYDKHFYAQQGIIKAMNLTAWNTDINYLATSIANPPVRMTPFRVGAVGNADEGVLGSAAFSAWRITSLPTNGTLFDSAGDPITSVPFDMPDNHPEYRSSSGFEGIDTYQFCAVDDTGCSTIATVSVPVATHANYEMPIGWPAALSSMWGTTEQADEPASWTSAPGTEVPGYWYIDANQGDCDDSQTYGSPDTPLCSWSGNFPNNYNSSGTITGKTIKLVPKADGSCYNLSSGGTIRNKFEGGTEAAPFFLLGDPTLPTEKQPKICAEATRTTASVWGIDGSHIIIDGIAIRNLRVEHQNSKNDGIDDDGLVLRNSSCKDIKSSSGNCFNIGGAHGFDANAATYTGPPYEAPNDRVTRAGVFNTVGANNGERAADLEEEQDVHAFTCGNNENGFFLDNTGYGNSGDFLQCTQKNNNAKILISGNDAHGDSENAVDIKAHEDVVITQNWFWDYRAIQYTSSSGNGQAIVQNDDDENWQSDDVTVALNVVGDVNGQGIGATINQGRMTVYGNVVLKALGDGATGIRIQNAGSQSSVYAMFNTVIDATRAFHLEVGSNSASWDTIAFGNYVAGAQYNAWALAPSTFDLFDQNYYDDAAGSSGWQCCSNGSPVFHTTLAGWQSASGQSQNAEMGVSPDFRELTPWDVYPEATFGGVDQFTEAQIEALAPGWLTFFRAELGITAIPDIYGTTRTGSWDAGAFESISFAGGVEASGATGPSQTPTAALQDQSQITGTGHYLWRVKEGSLDSRISLTPEAGGEYSVTIDAGTPTGFYIFTVELYEVATGITTELPPASFRRVEVQ